MSGHSKWATIKHKKEAQDAKRGKVFTKLSRMISIAARGGGSPDPETNYKLRLAVEQAKKANMPLEKIKKAIDRVYGKEKDKIENVTLEVFGPAGVGIIVQGLTDNRRRFVGEVKNVLGKHGGSLGQSGAVSYMFEEVVIIEVDKKISDEEILEWSELGLVDFRFDGGKTILYVKPEQLSNLREKLVQTGYPLSKEQLGFLAKNPLHLEEKEWLRLVNLLEQLENIDDVYALYHSGVEQEQ